MSDGWSKHCEPPRHVWAWTTSMGLNEPLRCWCGQTLCTVTYDPQGTWRLELLGPSCDAKLYMWEGEYEGECELVGGHEGAHFDGLSTWRTDDDGYTDYESVDEDPAPKAAT